MCVAAVLQQIAAKQRQTDVKQRQQKTSLPKQHFYEF